MDASVTSAVDLVVGPDVVEHDFTGGQPQHQAHPKRVVEADLMKPRQLPVQRVQFESRCERVCRDIFEQPGQLPFQLRMLPLKLAKASLKMRSGEQFQH